MKKIILILIAVMCAVIATMAQEAVVKSFEPAPMDVTAQQFARPDKHGNKCALVKVMVVAPNVSFQGNVMGDVQKRGSEYWVYMTEGTKMLRISADTFLAFMYDFPEPLQGGVTYMLTIQAPQPAGAAPSKPAENYLVLKIQPANANVFVKVDGTPKNVEDGMVTVSLSDGPHTYSVEAVGFAGQQGTVTMAGKRESRTIQLVSTKPTLTVSATTPGTEIFINDARKGTGSCSGELIADTYVVEGRLASHRTHSQKVTLAEGQNQRLTIPALTPITGSLNVNYKPVDATITIDGQPAGVTPNIIPDLLVGTHRVEIAAPGYTTATLTANVTESTPTTLTGSLTAKPSDPYADDIALTKEYQRFQDPSTGKYGYKHNGTIVIPAKYDWTYCFLEGLAPVKINGKYGFIDKSGTMVIPAKYDYAWGFNEGLAFVEINRKYGYIDKSGTMVIPATYDWCSIFSEGLAPVKINGKDGFIDKSGTMVIPAIYDSSRTFEEGLALVKINGKMGFINKNGTMVIPAKYDHAWDFHEGMATVNINGKWGFIDKNGIMVIPLQYDDDEVIEYYGGYRFKNGKARVKLNGREFFIDKNGNEVK